MPMPSQTTPSSRAAKLSVRGVGKRYDLGNRMMVEAVRDVSFDVTEGEICALLGPSGCGKSTVLRMVAGLEAPSNGAMFLDGKEIHGPDKSRGMVFQRYTSFDWMTVRKNVEYGMRINGVPRDERQRNAERFIQLVKLTKFKDAYPRELSGGMQQRVAIARTLANGPSILLMDEPFGALDAETKWQMQELMVSIVEKSNATVLLVTHDIDEAIFLADRIIFMSRHPGTIRENLVTEFKGGRRLASHEEMLEADGFYALAKKIMHLMREEMRGDPKSRPDTLNIHPEEDDPMCGVCGCSHQGDDHHHHHDHDHHHREGQAGHAPHDLVRIEKDILAKNDAYAKENRERLKEAGVFAINLVSSPGSGKTTLLVKTIDMLKSTLPVAVIEGDQETSLDAERIRATRVPTVQINTGRGCHLDAHMVGHALESLPLKRNSILFIENVGNLVCPAGFDLGEAHKVAILSVTEGDDKPLKYPDTFAAASMMVLSKIDLLPHLDFDVGRCIEHARSINPDIAVLQVSARSGEGMVGWIDWLLNAAERAARAQGAAHFHA